MCVISLQITWDSATSTNSVTGTSESKKRYGSRFKDLTKVAHSLQIVLNAQTLSLSKQVIFLLHRLLKKDLKKSRDVTANSVKKPKNVVIKAAQSTYFRLPNDHLQWRHLPSAFNSNYNQSWYILEASKVFVCSFKRLLIIRNLNVTKKVYSILNMVNLIENNIFF